MIGWLADRRRARRERDTEQRLRRLIEHVAATSADFYVPANWVDVLGRLKVNTILAEYGLPPVVEVGR